MSTHGCRSRPVIRRDLIYRRHNYCDFVRPDLLREQTNEETGPEMKNLQFRVVSLAGVAAILGLIGAAGLTSTPVAAQGTPEQQQACQSDAFRLCNEFIPDVARTSACMARKRASLSPACRSEFSHPSHAVRSHRRHH
jgi:hypothetical protein